MRIEQHFQVTFGALKHWFIAQCYDSAIVGLLWLAALWLLHVPWALFWSLLGGALQFIPNFGPVLALIGPVIALAVSKAGWQRFIGLLLAYVVIAVADGLLLQPYLMRRQNRVPMWASILAPLVLGFVIPFWGVLLAPPLLAIVYAYGKRKPEKVPVRSGQAVILPPEHPPEGRGGDGAGHA